MEAVVYGALEEICSQGVNGLTLGNLWPKLHSHLSANGLHLCNNVKKALWRNLLEIPSLRFEYGGVSYGCEDPRVQSVEECEAMDLKIVAVEHLLNSFVGIYDIKASDAGISQQQRRALERLAIARTNGVTQSEIAKEFGIKGNNIYYVLKNLESRGLIVRQSTIVRKKEAGSEGEYKNGSIVNTNMLHLYRYAKHLGRLQRLEITKEDKAFTDNANADGNPINGDGVSEESVKDDVQIKDYVPDLKAICDRLEKADGKVLIVSDIKRELGYCKTSGHRAWRNILKRLEDDRLVEEFFATVNNKEVSCLRLLKKFSLKTCAPKTHGGGDDDLDTEPQVKLGKRGQITDQLLELPIEQQIYDMIDAEGSKGLINNDIYKRLGISHKRYYLRILDMVSRFGMHLDSECLNRGKAYRVWTSGNFNTKFSNAPPGKSEDTMDVNCSKADAKASEEQDINPIDSGFTRTSPIVSHTDMLLGSNSSQNMVSEESGIVPEAELQIINVKPAPNVVSLEIAPSASPTTRRRRSYITYPCLNLNSISSQREQLILEKLQEEKILIKPELHRMLESLDNHEKEKHTMMDRRTLERSVNKLQVGGHCKCISFTVPVVTNCGRKRTVDVILHPSVYNAEDLSDRVHERIRFFERQIRTQPLSRQKGGKSIPILNDVERIGMHMKKDVSAETCEAMRNNGFVLAKMVRAKLLHIFLWGYLTRLPGWDDAILTGEHRYERKNPHSTCKLLELDVAIKAMPLELFLQVVGSHEKIESMIEKCRDGLCLSDLPLPEYRCLMETRATARLSYLIDILRRLKLIRLIGGELDPTVRPHTTLRHSLELKPYIEEPVAKVLPSTGLGSIDLRPHVRHDFVLESRKGVNEYWNTLEYCYAASDPKAALHAFPGSAVHEVFLSRSWASVRVMTTDQRAELFKLVENEDMDKKISFKKCEKIAENLGLTLEQVLRVFYDKRRKDKLKGAASAKDQPQPQTPTSLSHKRKRSSKGKLINSGKSLMENPLNEESDELNHTKISNAEDVTEGWNSVLKSLEGHETHTLINPIGGHEEVIDDMELNADIEGDPYSSIHEGALSMQKSERSKRFAWTEDKDRQLVIEYVRYRAALGAKFRGTDWASLQNLPGPPVTCGRRMSTLNRNNQFKKAVMRLCNMLSVRYAKHLENSKNKSLGDNCRKIVQCRICNKDTNKNSSDCFHRTKDLNFKERWDDFDNEDIKMVLDEVFRYKQAAKLEVIKGAQCISKYPQSSAGAEGQEFHETSLVSSANPSNELNKGNERKQVSARRSKRRLPKNYAMLMNGGKGFGTQAYKSLAVSNAVELFKLVFLSTAKAPEVPNLLAETLRRYSEHDLFAAFNYLRERNFMVGGNGVGQFVLSQQFLRNMSSSPFPVNTGKRAVKMAGWLHEKDSDLLDEGVVLSADLQCGDVFHLCMLMCSGEVSIFPCLPDEGVGEIEDLKKRKCHDNEVCSVDKTKRPKLLDSEVFSRKEKGFPGIQLSLSRSMISRVDAITLFKDENAHSVLFSGSERGTSSCLSLENNSAPFERSEESFGSGDAFSKTDAASESTWEAMTCYAAHLRSCKPEESPFYPNLFRTVYSTIQKAGDQGLSMEEIAQITDVQGREMTELIVEVLETFGRALKVNAYNSVHVVDSLYQPKYLLTSIVSRQQDLNFEVPKRGTSEGEPSKLQLEYDEDKDTNIPTEMSPNLDEAPTNAENVHRVTILNHPEEVSQPMSEIQRKDETETHNKAKVMSPRKDPEKEASHIADSPSYKPILPWINGDGTINEIVYKGLKRRVLGIVMQNPGIPEEHILSQMNVLNPQSCRKLLELMILDNHIMVRKMYESTSTGPPAILGRLLGSKPNKPKLVYREHLFANPASISCL